MTKFVTVVMAVAFTVVFSAAVMADNGWTFGNWEPPTKVPVVKAVSLNADWGTTAVEPAASVAPAGCRGMAQHTHAEPAMRAGCSGGGWFLGKRIMANRKARARNREARAWARANASAHTMGSGHS